MLMSRCAASWGAAGPSRGPRMEQRGSGAQQQQPQGPDQVMLSRPDWLRVRGTRMDPYSGPGWRRLCHLFPLYFILVYQGGFIIRGASQTLIIITNYRIECQVFFFCFILRIYFPSFATDFLWLQHICPGALREWTCLTGLSLISKLLFHF